MSSTPEQLDADAPAVELSSSAARLFEWQEQLDQFTSSVETELSEILKSLSKVTAASAPPARISPASPLDRTADFRLPDVPKPSPTPVPVSSSIAAGDPEPNRLAALKAKLTKQMASSGHSADPEGFGA